MTFVIVREPLSFIARRAWQYSSGQRVRLVSYVFLAILSMVVGLGEPLIIAKLLNVVQGAKSIDLVMNEIAFWLVALGALQVGIWLFHGPSRVIEREVAYTIRICYQRTIFSMIASLPMCWHRDNHSGETIDKLSRASTALNDTLDNSFETIHILTRFLGSLICLSYFMPEAGLVVLAATAVTIAINVLFDRVLLHQYESLNGFSHRAATAVHDFLTNIRTVVSLRLEKSAECEVVTRLNASRKVFSSNIVLNEVKWFITTVVICTMISGVLIWYCSRVSSSGAVFEAGTFVALFEYLRRIGDAFFGFAGKYGTLVTAAARLASADQIVRDYVKKGVKSEPQGLPHGWKKLEVKNLSFTYQKQDGSRMHLQDVYITLRRGEAVALVGESGSGKSTLLALLRGLEETPAVEVDCDGKTLTDGFRSIARHTALIPQDPEIFATTIRQNITMGEDVSEEEILRLVDISRFAPVIPKLPRGLETNIAEKGINLSGGEKQRLALARGMLFARHRELVLLDEPTSSVDPQNERLIYERLLAECRDRVVVSAVHRLHLLPLFDRVYVFADGRVIEHGTYEELMSNPQGALSGLFAVYGANGAVDDPELDDVKAA